MIVERHSRNDIFTTKKSTNQKIKTWQLYNINTKERKCHTCHGNMNNVVATANIMLCLKFGFGTLKNQQ